MAYGSVLWVRNLNIALRLALVVLTGLIVLLWVKPYGGTTLIIIWTFDVACGNVTLAAVQNPYSKHWLS